MTSQYYDKHNKVYGEFADHAMSKSVMITYCINTLQADNVVVDGGHEPQC